MNCRIRSGADCLSAVLGGFLWTLAAVLLVCGAGFLGWRVVTAAPSGWLVEEATVRLSVDDPKPLAVSWSALGRREAMPSPPAFFLRRLADGGWTMERPPGASGVSMVEPRRRRLDALTLRSGLLLSVGGVALEVVEAGAERLVVVDQAGGRRLEVGADGMTTMTPAAALPTCQLDRLIWESPDWLLRFDDWRRRQRIDPAEPVMTWGGGVDCPTRWALSASPPGAFGLSHVDGAWTLVPLAPGVDLTLRTRGESGGGVSAFAGRPIRLPLSDIDGAGRLEIAVGPVIVGVRAEEDRLVLTPRGGRQLLDWQAASDDPRITVADIAVPWLGAPGERWLADPAVAARVATMAAAAALGALTVATSVWVWRGRRSGLFSLMRPGLAASGLAGLTAVALAATLAPYTPVTAWGGLAMAAWLWTTLILATGGWLRGAGGLLWLLVGVVVVIGILTQLQLAAGGVEEGRLALPRGQAAGVALAALAVGAAALPSPRAWRNWLTLRLGAEGPPWLWLSCVAAACLAALAHGLWGRETGLGGLQPAEFFKSAWVLAFAAGAAWFLHLARLGAVGTRWWRVVAALVLTLGGLGAAIAGALAAVDDFSPLVVLAVAAAVAVGQLTLRCALLFWRADRRVSRWTLLPPLAVIGLLLAGAGWLAHSSLVAGPDAEIEAAAAVSVVGNRVDVWENPERFPNSGEQVRRAQAPLRDLPLLPEPVRPFDMRCDETVAAAATGKNCREQAIPAVENDFVVAFWLTHAGRVGGAVLALAQWGALATLAGLAWRVGGGELAADFLHLATGGFAAALACQWIIGWANPLGLLPVMGQPATFLSAGNSHLAFFALPCLLTGLLSAAIGALDARARDAG